MPDSTVLVKEVKDAVERFVSPSAQKKRAQWRQPYAAGLRFVLLELIDGSSWKELKHFAAHMRNDVSHHVEDLARQQRECRHMTEGLALLRDEFEVRWRRPSVFEEWTNTQHRLIEELQGKGMERDDATEAIKDFGRATPRDVWRFMEQPIAAWESELDSCSIGRFAAFAAADLADAVARFNQYVSHGGGEAHVPTAEVTAQLQTQLRQLHDELKNENRDKLERVASETEAQIESTLEPLIRAAAHLSGKIAASKDASLGRSGIAVADTIRLSLFVRSAARIIAWASGWGERSALLQRWRTAAHERPFKSVFQAPPTLSLRELVASHSADERRVAVEGWMGSITIAHHGRKVVSRGTLADRAGHTVTVGLPYIKLDSGGVVPDTYVRLVGTYYQQHHEFEGPVVIPARRNLTHDSQHSWIDWLTLRLMPIATPVAHNICARWSWAAGRNGAANPLRYGTWRETRKGLH